MTDMQLVGRGFGGRGGGEIMQSLSWRLWKYLKAEDLYVGAMDREPRVMWCDVTTARRTGWRYKLNTEVQTACQLDRVGTAPPPECRQGGSLSRPERECAEEEFPDAPPARV